MKVLGLIFAGSKNDNLDTLTSKRTTSALPIYGKYRTIDFSLSNMINSGIKKVGVLTQYNPRSLMDHLGSGKEWNLDRKRGGMLLLQPFLTNEDTKAYYRGTADAIFQNITVLKKSEENYVLITSGDQVCNMDLKDVFKYHVRNAADVTLITKNNESNEYQNQYYDQIEIKDENIVSNVFHNIKEKKANDIFTGSIFINKVLLMELLYSAVPQGKFDILNDIIVPNLNKIKVVSYSFDGYWKNVKNSKEEYYNTSMDFFNRDIRKELFFSGRKIYTKLKDYAPSKININSKVSNSLISDGCIINGCVRNSIVSRGVIIKAGAQVENSIIMQDSIVEEGAVIKKLIIDKNVVIREGKRLESFNNEIITIEKGTVI